MRFIETTTNLWGATVTREIELPDRPLLGMEGPELALITNWLATGSFDMAKPEAGT